MSYGAFCLLDFACSLVATDGTIRKSRKNDESLQPKVENGMQGFWCRLYELVPLYCINMSAITSPLMITLQRYDVSLNIASFVSTLTQI